MCCVVVPRAERREKVEPCCCALPLSSFSSFSPAIRGQPAGAGALAAASAFPSPPLLDLFPPPPLHLPPPSAFSFCFFSLARVRV